MTARAAQPPRAARLLRAALLAALLAASAACRPAADVLPVTAEGIYIIDSASWGDIFRALWQAVSDNYVYWDIENDGYWDGVREKYQGAFDAFGDAGGAYDDVAWRMLTDIVLPLRDGHFQLSVLGLAQGAGGSVYPALERVKSRIAALPLDQRPWSGEDEEDISELILDAVYPNMIAGSRAWYSEVTDDSGDDPVTTALIGTGNIALESGEGGKYAAYLYFKQFCLSDRLAAEKKAAEQPFTDCLNRFWHNARGENCAGVIFDIRGNPGGSAADIAYLLSPFLSRSLTFAYLRSKKGDGRLNYLPWTPFTLPSGTAAADAPLRAGREAGNLGIVCLVDDYTVSAGELLALAVRSMGGVLAGTRTLGATGPRYSDETPVYLNGGAFTLRTSSGAGPSFYVIEAACQTRGANGENYESVGLLPETGGSFSRSAFLESRDLQLQAALAALERP